MSVCMREGLFEMGAVGLHMSGIRLQTSPCLLSVKFYSVGKFFQKQ